MKSLRCDDEFDKIEYSIVNGGVWFVIAFAIVLEVKVW